jgi:hypothetical protein
MMTWPHYRSGTGGKTGASPIFKFSPQLAAIIYSIEKAIPECQYAKP